MFSQTAFDTKDPAIGRVGGVRGQGSSEPRGSGEREEWNTWMNGGSGGGGKLRPPEKDPQINFPAL